MATPVPSPSEPIERKRSCRGASLLLLLVGLVVGAAGAVAWQALDSLITLPIL
jgi:hypothetical protein